MQTHPRPLVAGVTHDLSKFSLTEFVSSAKYFQGNKSPIEAEKAEKDYSIAWQHHQNANPHHFEWWLDIVNFKELKPIVIPWNFVMEMLCDIIGAGKAYNPKGWNPTEPLKYFMEHHWKSDYIHPATKGYMKWMLEIFSFQGYWLESEWVGYKKVYQEFIDENKELIAEFRRSNARSLFPTNS